jgi:ABC-2 type transport system ATP-binding protein
MGHAIAVDGLVVAYGPKVAVDGLSFAVDPGEVVALLGPNGAGKTSTVETVEGYRPPTEGTVRVLGVEPARAQAELAKRLGVMLQEGGVPSRLSPAKVLGVTARFYDHPWPVAELMERVGLTAVASTPYRRLSGGEKQRLGLALALVGRPEVLVADEPTAGVDPVGKASIRALIEELRTQGVAVLVTGHELEEIDKVVDRVLILETGRLRAEGTPAELKARFGVRGVEFRVGGTLGEALGRLKLVRVGEGRYRVEGEPTPQLVADVLAALGAAGLEAEDLRTVTPSLEEVYLAVIGGRE